MINNYTGVADKILGAFAIAAGKLDAPNMIECNMRKNGTGEYVDFQARYDAGNFDLVPPRIK